MNTLGPPGTGKSTVTILLDAIGMTIEQLYKDVLLAATNRTNQNLARAWKDIAEEGTLACASVSRHPARAQEPVVGIDRTLWADHVKAAVCVSTHAKADLALQQAYFNPLRATFHTYDEDQNDTDMSTATTQGITDGNTMDCRQGDKRQATGAEANETIRTAARLQRCLKGGLANPNREYLPVHVPLSVVEHKIILDIWKFFPEGFTWKCRTTASPKSLPPIQL